MIVSGSSGSISKRSCVSNPQMSRILSWRIIRNFFNTEKLIRGGYSFQRVFISFVSISRLLSRLSCTIESKPWLDPLGWEGERESVATLRRGRTWSRSLTPTWTLSPLPSPLPPINACWSVWTGFAIVIAGTLSLCRTIFLCNGRESCATSNTAHSLARGRERESAGGEMEARCAIHLPRSSLSREFHFTDYVAVPRGTRGRSPLSSSLLLLLVSRSVL